MEVKVGIQHVSREIVVESAESASAVEKTTQWWRWTVLAPSPGRRPLIGWM